MIDRRAFLAITTTSALMAAGREPIGIGFLGASYSHFSVSSR